MRRLIYASSSSVELTSAQLDEIAIQARERNSIAKISGLLLYGDHSFFQVIEGSTASIDDLKTRIWKDQRHRGISKLQDKAVDSLVFPD